MNISLPGTLYSILDIKNLQLFTILLILSACGTVKLLAPSQADAERGAMKFEGLTLERLTQGKSLYENHCGICHRLKNPASRNEKAWNKIVPVMVKKVNRKAGKEEIDAAEKGLILQYLVTMESGGK